VASATEATEATGGRAVTTVVAMIDRATTAGRAATTTASVTEVTGATAARGATIGRDATTAEGDMKAGATTADARRPAGRLT
jgi:hypothetical protein